NGLLLGIGVWLIATIGTDALDMLIVDLAVAYCRVALCCPRWTDIICPEFGCGFRGFGLARLSICALGAKELAAGQEGECRGIQEALCGAQDGVVLRVGECHAEPPLLRCRVALSGEVMPDRRGRLEVIPLARLVLPVQTVDATPSSVLIQ